MSSAQTAVIVFYSRHGSTRLGAELLAKQTGAALCELEEARRGNVLQAFFRLGSKLAGDPWRQIAGARDVYLLLPIWASNCVPAMNAFLKKADFYGKNVCIVTFQQSGFLQGSAKVHDDISEQVEHTYGTVRARCALIGARMGRCAEKSEIEAQLGQVPLSL